MTEPTSQAREVSIESLREQFIALTNYAQFSAAHTAQMLDALTELAALRAERERVRAEAAESRAEALGAKGGVG